MRSRPARSSQLCCMRRAGLCLKNAWFAPARLWYTRSMIKSIFGHSIVRGMIMGFGVVIIFGAYVFVRAQVFPGAIQSPFFGPQDDDVTVPIGDIPCTWTGWERKRIACDNGGLFRMCAGIEVFCDNGVV